MDPYLGSIQWVGFGFVPTGWALCDGSLLAIAQNQALFALLGTTYGGNGVQTFALPDLRSATPLGAGGVPPTGLPPVQPGQRGQLAQSSGAPVAATLGLVPIIALEGIFPSRW